MFLAGYVDFNVPDQFLSRDDEIRLKIPVQAAPTHLFHFPSHLCINSYLPNEQKLLAAPPPDPKPGYSFVSPKEWELQIDKHCKFIRGCYYLNKRSEADVDELRRQVLCIQRHPDLIARLVDDPLIPGRQMFTIPEAPRGLIKMIPGIPYYVGATSNPINCYFAGITHTPETFLQLYSQKGNPIGKIGADALQEIQRIILEKSGNDSFWMDPSLKENDRSSRLGNGEGSFSIAATLVKGEGLGMIAPAAQSALPTVQNAHRRLFEAVSRVHRVMRLTSLRVDHYVMGEAELLLNNVPQVGEDSGITSIQMNIHFSDRSLQLTIGDVQGGLHQDDLDEPTRATSAIVVTTTPYGE
jgi:hypothetical protein